jgi:hypothetical protein
MGRCGHEIIGILDVLEQPVISAHCKKIRIDQRLYRDNIDTPKTVESTRTIAIPSKTAKQLKRMDGSGRRQAQFVGLRFGEFSEAPVEG